MRSSSTRNLLENKDHIKARSTVVMGDSADSYNHRKLEPSLSLSCSSSYITHDSASPKKNATLFSPQIKTSRLKLFRKSETLFAHPDSQKRAGMLRDDKGSDVSKIKKNASYNHCSSEGEMRGAEASRAVEVEEGRTECSMCGDVGIAELLFLCSKCFLRPQHTYCGRSYPYVCGEASICNWCLHEQDSSSVTAAKASVLCHNISAIENSDMNVRTAVDVTRSVEKLPNAASACIHESCTADDAMIETVGRHGKAFDYLLLVAAQSGLPQVISEASEIKQTNQAATVTNSTGSKIMTTSSHKKPNLDCEMKAMMGLTESNHGSVANETRSCKGGERSPTGLVEKLNVELQSAGNMKVKVRSDGPLYARESMSKRQRCGKVVDVPAVKCRKRGLQLSPARPNYRRYKLLADVVC